MMLNPVRIPARPREAIHKTRSDRIADDRHDDRYCCRCALERRGRGCSARHDDIDIGSYELGGELWKALNLVLCPFPLDRNRLPLDIAEIPQTFEKCFGANRERRRGAPHRAPREEQASRARAQDVARATARARLRQVPDRRRHPLRLEPLGRAHLFP
jgi:hypothetical protein